ncbi:MAG: hypothetical protein FJ291_24235 [Planctomycetes bacterium]|nr:hypothetical protein [Planctomycetota bacterium]
MKKTVLHIQAEQIWAAWRADADFQQLFGAANQRDYGSLRIMADDFSQWANNAQGDIPAEFQAEAWLAEPKQESLIEASAVLATPLLNQLDNRFGLSWLTQLIVGRGTYLMVPDLADEKRLGVCAGIRRQIICRVWRDVRDGGLYL